MGDAQSVILVRALQRDPELRYPSVDALLEALLAHLHSLRLDEPRKGLKEFFANPEECQRRLERQTVETLLETGREDLRRGSHARAFALLNRVLAFDPHHAEVKALLGNSVDGGVSSPSCGWRSWRPGSCWPGYPSRGACSNFARGAPAWQPPKGVGMRSPLVPAPMVPRS